jgi:hypothetical protein
MDQIKLLESIFDKKSITLLRLFLNNQDKQYYVREVAKATKTPLATTFRILQKYIELKVISQTKIKHLRLYQLMRNENTAFLIQLFEEKKTIMQSFVDQVSTIDGVQSILLHGQEEKDKANIVLIGKSIDELRVREIVVAIKNEYNFSIAHLILDPNQFSQMESMGLFPGKKVILYEKQQQ